MKEATLDHIPPPALLERRAEVDQIRSPVVAQQNIFNVAQVAEDDTVRVNGVNDLAQLSKEDLGEIVDRHLRAVTARNLGDGNGIAVDSIRDIGDAGQTLQPLMEIDIPPDGKDTDAPAKGEFLVGIIFHHEPPTFDLDDVNIGLPSASGAEGCDDPSAESDARQRRRQR